MQVALGRLLLLDLSSNNLLPVLDLGCGLRARSARGMLLGLCQLVTVHVDIVTWNAK